jgi:hypothetical protein
MATPQYPRFQMPGTATASTPQASNIINNAIPNFSGLSSSASGIVGNLMGGMPSSGPAKERAAAFGVGSGMPGSGLSKAFGYDLYNRDADQYQQRGFDNFLKLIQGYSGTVSPTTGQQMQQNQFDQDLAFRRDESAINAEQANRRLGMEYERMNPRKASNPFPWTTWSGRKTSRPTLS